VRMKWDDDIKKNIWVTACKVNRTSWRPCTRIGFVISGTKHLHPIEHSVCWMPWILYIASCKTLERGAKLQVTQTCVVAFVFFTLARSYTSYLYIQTQNSIFKQV
jgi:hypothetical protein